MRQDAPYASAEPAPEEEEEDADDDAMGEAIRAIVEAKLGAEQD
jgi:hypothetical protein